MSSVLALVGMFVITRSFLQAVSHFSLRRRLQLSLFWVTSAITCEFVLGHIVAEVPLERLLEGYDVTSGVLWPIILLGLAAAPFIVGSRSPERSPR